MKAKYLVSGALLWSSLACGWGQTNLSSSDFTLPPMNLRAELSLDAPQPQPPSPFPNHAFPTNAPEREVTATTLETPGALEGYNTRSDRFYLTPALEPPPETPIGRALDSVARPEVVRMGEADLSCSIITAVKRKNPLCLVNATFLDLTW